METHTLDDRFDSERRLAGKSIWKDVTGSNFDSLLEKVVLEDDESGIHGRDVAHDVVPVIKNFLNAYVT